MKYTVLLTATIDTNNCINTKRNNIGDRINDYYLNIKKILEETNFDIVFVENSYSDLNIIKDFLNNERVEIIQYNGNNFNRNLGKGHGEWGIINYAIENSSKIKKNDYIIKLTGRYRINFNNIISELNNNFVLYENETNLNENWAFTGFFKITKDFWIENIQKSYISDDPGCYIENVVAYNLKKINHSITYVKNIELSGISGTHNKEI